MKEIFMHTVNIQTNKYIILSYPKGIRKNEYSLYDIILYFLNIRRISIIDRTI